MEDSSDNCITIHSSTGDSENEKQNAESPLKPKDTSQNLFSDSPVYEPEDDIKCIEVDSTTEDTDPKVDHLVHAKRKLSEDSSEGSAKILKLELTNEEVAVSSQTLDDEVSEITSIAKQKLDDVLPSTSRVRTPVRSSPRKVSKRSNSVELTPKTPKTPKSRSSSVDTTKSRKTPRKVPLDLFKEKVQKDDEVIVINSENSSRPSVEFVLEIPSKVIDTIPEESASDTLNDSQNFQLLLSPVEDDQNSSEKPKIQTNFNSDPVIVKDREEILDAGKIQPTRSEGYNYSDLSSNLSQPMPKDYNRERATDQESTDSIGSMVLDSPEPVPSVASKLISKLSNGNSSTPTEVCDDGSQITPDMSKLNGNKGKRAKNEIFRANNTTTPSTISPLQNGHSLPIHTPHIPIFDVHVNHNDDCEFLSLYVVRTDSDVGMDMYKEYQRISKRFTIDPYLGDVSVSNSPSSVTSGGMINLANRTSFASTVSSSSASSTRTSDGAFVVPQPPRKSVSNPSTTVKGYEALMKKLQDIFSHIRDASIAEENRSLNDDKISVGIQASMSENAFSNGNASPEEVSKCDKATPKSSLKKSRVRGRRPIAGKTKRALLPTQHEEVEYMHGINSPEMVPSNGDNGKMSPVKFLKDEKPLSSVVGTPKSITKLKQKRRPTSPRPATPVEKTVVKPEYPGFAPDTVVLAKWVDKRYYSGKVLEITELNKYLIKFDDGQSKILLDDFIIFGDMKKLPLQGQSVYALVDEEQNYEPGLVLGVEENDSGTVTYKCTTDGDTIVVVTASELYLTEDQARSLKESRARSPAAPSTPRRRHHRELDLDNIIQGPRSARTRDKGNSSARKRVASPKSPKASTSGLKTKSIARKRLASESSEMSESSNSAPTRIEEVAGVEPEVQRTPRKIDGLKAGPLQLKGAAKQNIGKKNSKLTKFENDEDTVSALGPIPNDSKMFSGMCFLLTCTEPPKTSRGDRKEERVQDSRHYSSEEDGESTAAGTDSEDLVFCDRAFNKERLREQLEAAGGTVYSHFDDLPTPMYPLCKLIAPRPCLTAKYISCVSAGVRALSHAWVIQSCVAGRVLDVDSYSLPAGWSLRHSVFVNWDPPSGKRNTTFFKDKIILLCGDQDTFVKFWERVCTLAGATTRVVNEDNLNMCGALTLVTEWDCPHEVQNKANQDNIPLVSTTWVVQCLIEGLKTKSIARKRLASESSEMSESSNSAPTRIEEVAGVEPEVQRTPRKIDGLKAGPLQLKGAAKQNIGKKNSKLTKFENDEDTVSALGPIPNDSKMFSGMCFLLTCTEPPKTSRGDRKEERVQDSRHYSSEEDGESTAAGTDSEDLVFCDRAFNKERLREQLEAAGGTVYSHFDDLPTPMYPLCKLIAPRPCLTAKYISCVSAGVRALSHAWVIQSCVAGRVLDVDSYSLPAGWSLRHSVFVNWDPPSGKRNTTFFKDKIILLCGDQDTFVKFWERVCTLAGATTRVVNEDNLNMCGALTLVTEWDCPHEVQNKANQDNIPLVSTTWVVQCLIEGKVIAPTALDKFSFMYAEPE